MKHSVNNVIDIEKYIKKDGYLFTEDELVEIVHQWCEMLFDKEELQIIGERLRELGYEE